jgi:ankyrin repeat protein
MKLFKFNIFNDREFGDKLYKVCKDNDEDAIKALIHSNDSKFKTNIFDQDNWVKIENALCELLKHKNSSMIKYIFTRTQLKDSKSLEIYVNALFQVACWHGDLDSVKFFLTSPELKKNADINSSKDTALQFACGQYNEDIIKYLLESPELKTHSKVQNDLWSNIENKDLEVIKYFLEKSESLVDEAFISACKNGNLDKVKFFLHSKEINKNADIHAHRDKGFVTALMCVKEDVLHYLIFDMNIPRTNYIEEALKDSSHPSCISLVEKVNKWFALRELNEQLNNELSINVESNSRRPKL